MAAVLRQGVVVPGPGMPPRYLAIVPPPEPVEETTGSTAAVDSMGISYYPSFQPGYRLIDGSDLIALANIVGGGSILNFGGNGDGVTDNTPALMRALNAGVTTISFPPGVFYFASPVSYTLPNGYAAVVITGSGVDTTRIRCPGWTFNFQSIFNGMTIANMSFLADQAGSTTALIFNATFSSPAGQPGLAMSNLQNLAFFGLNGPATAPFYWGTAIDINGCSNFNFTNVIITAEGMTSPATPFVGRGVNLAGTPNAIGIVFNFTNCAFNMLAIGIEYGSNVQGVAVANTNFTCNAGVYVPSGVVNTYQLSISNSQIGCISNNSVGINDPLGQLTDIMVVGTEFAVEGTNAIGMQIVRSLAVSVVGCVFELSATTTGIIMSQAYPGDPFQFGAIVGNVFHSTSGSGGSAIQTATPQEIIHGLNCFDPNLAAGIVGATTGDTGMIIQVLDTTGWVNVKVTAGAANSGGTGFRTLLIPN